MTEKPREWPACIIAVILAIAAAIWLCGKAHAHDPEHPELNGWYMGLHSKAHVACCDGADAKHLATEDWDVKDGHYRVRLGGQWIDVPDDAVVDGPNKDGRTLVWPVYISGLSVYIRCFMPGAGT